MNLHLLGVIIVFTVLPITSATASYFIDGVDRWIDYFWKHFLVILGLGITLFLLVFGVLLIVLGSNVQ